MTTPTRWLNADEQRAWRLFIQACEAVFGATDAQLIRDSGIPHGYYVPVSGNAMRLLIHGYSRLYAVEPRAIARR